MTDIYEGDIDFTALNNKLKRMKPKPLSKKEIVAKLYDGIIAAKNNGVNDEEIIKLLAGKPYNIKLNISTLKSYLSEGKPGTRINSDKAELAAEDLNDKYS